MAKKKAAANAARGRGRVSLSGTLAPGERSPIVGLRFPPAELAAIDKLADREGLKRSEMVRRLVALGLEKIKGR